MEGKHETRVKEVRHRQKFTEKKVRRENTEQAKKIKKGVRDWEGEKKNGCKKNETKQNED